MGNPRASTRGLPEPAAHRDDLAGLLGRVEEPVRAERERRRPLQPGRVDLRTETRRQLQGRCGTKRRRGRREYDRRGRGRGDDSPHASQGIRRRLDRGAPPESQPPTRGRGGRERLLCVRGCLGLGCLGLGWELGDDGSRLGVVGRLDRGRLDDGHVPRPGRIEVGVARRRARGCDLVEVPAGALLRGRPFGEDNEHPCRAHDDGDPGRAQVGKPGKQSHADEKGALDDEPRQCGRERERRRYRRDPVGRRGRVRAGLGRPRLFVVEAGRRASLCAECTELRAQLVRDRLELTHALAEGGEGFLDPFCVERRIVGPRQLAHPNSMPPFSDGPTGDAPPRTRRLVLVLLVHAAERFLGLLVHGAAPLLE